MPFTKLNSLSLFGGPSLCHCLCGGSDGSCLWFLQSLWLGLWLAAARLRSLLATALFWTFAMYKVNAMSHDSILKVKASSSSLGLPWHFQDLFQGNNLQFEDGYLFTKSHRG